VKWIYNLPGPIIIAGLVMIANFMTTWFDGRAWLPFVILGIDTLVKLGQLIWVPAERVRALGGRANPTWFRLLFWG